MGGSQGLGGMHKISSNGHTLKYRKFCLNIKKNPFSYCEGDLMLEQVSQKVSGVSIHGDTQNPSGHGPGQPALADTA